MNWNYDNTGEFGIYYDVDSDSNITTSGVVTASKSKTIKNIKTPDDNADGTDWQTLFSALETLFGFNGELRYFRGKAVLE